MTTSTHLRVFNPLGVLGTLLAVAAAMVLLVPLAVPAGSVQAELQGFVLQLLGTVTLLGLAFFALVSASERTHRSPAAAPTATPCGAARTMAHEPTGVAGAAA